MTIGMVTYSYNYVGVKGLFLIYGKNPIDGYDDPPALYSSFFDEQDEQFDCALKIGKVRAKDELVERR